MQIKAFIISISILISVALTGCAHNDYQENLKLFREFIQKIMYFYQGNGGNGDNLGADEETDNQNQDYLVKFKNALNNGSHFVLTKMAQTEYSEIYEEVFFAGEYIYKTSKLLSNISVVSSKLYLSSGKTYSYNDSVVTEDKSADFLAVKSQILNDLFSDNIIWENNAENYVYKNEDFTYCIKRKDENSLEYEIIYSAIDAWTVYKGEVNLCDSLAVDMPEQLKKYIR